MPQDIDKVGIGQCLQIGEVAEKPLEIWDDGRRGRLHQHHLGNQDAVRIIPRLQGNSRWSLYTMQLNAGEPNLPRTDQVLIMNVDCIP